MCVFGAANGSILALMLGKRKGSNPWEKGMNAYEPGKGRGKKSSCFVLKINFLLYLAFFGIGTAIEQAFLYYPFFGCLASYHKIVGALMGFIYGLI